MSDDDASDKAQTEKQDGYEDGAASKLGPSNLRHYEDGKVTIDGEEVDDPDEYKGEPIPGGPSDPDAPPDPAMIGQEDEDDDSSSSDAEASGEEARASTALVRTPPRSRAPALWG